SGISVAAVAIGASMDMLASCSSRRPVLNSRRSTALRPSIVAPVACRLHDIPEVGVARVRPVGCAAAFAPLVVVEGSHTFAHGDMVRGSEQDQNGKLGRCEVADGPQRLELGLRGETGPLAAEQPL